MESLTRSRVKVPKSLSHADSSADLLSFWKKQPYASPALETATTLTPSIDPNQEVMLSMGSSLLVWVMDMRTMRYIYLSPNVRCLLGYSIEQWLAGGLAFSHSLIHPDDLPHVCRLTRIVWDFLLKLPTHQRKGYKFNGDYRLRKADGTYLRLLEQNTVWQTDADGNITHLLCVGSDITHWKKGETLTTSVCTPENVTCLVCSSGEYTQAEQYLQLRSSVARTGECFSNDIRPETSSEAGNTPLAKKNTLSKREREIISLLFQGYNSRAIAEKLFIAVHTVNTHRQKILEKTGVKNVGGLIQFAKNNNLI